MYRGKRHLPHRVQKALSKEITRKGKAEIISFQQEPIAPPRHAKETRKMERAKNALAHTPVHSKGTRSKRTTPGPVIEKSSPAHVHPEGGRWIKTLVTQEKVRSKIRQKRDLKTRAM